MSAVLNISLHNGQVDHFFREWKDGSLVLNPDFQRSNMVWDVTRKSRLIESLIVGFPVPPIFLSETESQVREVVDGLQRMTSIFEFMADSYKLQELEFTSKINGSKFSDLSDTLKARVQRASLGFYVLPADSKHWGGRLKHIVFNRLNQGVPVNGIERIMGSEPGPGNALVVELSQDILNLWGADSKKSKGLIRRGKHLLYALTGAAAIQLEVGADCLTLNGWEYRRGGKNPWEGLLLTTLRQLNGMDDQARQDIKDSFQESLAIVSKVFGHPFQSWDEERLRFSPAVKDAALVTQMWGAARPSKWTESDWVAHKDEIEDAWKSYCFDHKLTHQANTLFSAVQGWGETLGGVGG